MFAYAMMPMKFFEKKTYDLILKNNKNNQKQLAVLLDPDKLELSNIPEIVKEICNSGADYIFAGGSLMVKPGFEEKLSAIKKHSKKNVVIFPGSPLQLSQNANSILLLSLISGRNPDLLIGQHVIAAPFLKASGLEIIPTGYILVDSGKSTTASYISNTIPVPFDKSEVAAITALAGEQMGLKCIYLDAGSGALKPISPEMITATKENISVPLIVGGGIKTPEQAAQACAAGADIIVIGTAFEKDLTLVKNIAQAIQS